MKPVCYSFVSLAAALVDIEARSQQDRDTTLTAGDLAEWKSEHGEFKYPTILLVRTGNAQHWSDWERYFGWEETTESLHFPGP